MAVFRKNSQRKKAKRRLENARVRTLQGFDQSDDNILISLPEERTGADTFFEAAGGIGRWVLCLIVFFFFFTGVVAVVVPESREILSGILKDALRNLSELIGA